MEKNSGATFLRGLSIFLFKMHGSCIKQATQHCHNYSSAIYYCNHFIEKSKSGSPFRKRKLEDTPDQVLRYDKIDH